MKVNKTVINKQKSNRFEVIKSITPISVRLIMIGFLWEIYINIGIFYNYFFLIDKPGLSPFLRGISVLLLIVVFYLFLKADIKYVYFLITFFIFKLGYLSITEEWMDFYLLMVIFYILFIWHLTKLLKLKDLYRDNKKFIRWDKLMTVLVIIKIFSGFGIFWLSILSLMSILGFNVSLF